MQRMLLAMTPALFLLIEVAPTEALRQRLADAIAPAEVEEEEAPEAAEIEQEDSDSAEEEDEAPPCAKSVVIKIAP